MAQPTMLELQKRIEALHKELDEISDLLFQFALQEASKGTERIKEDLKDYHYHPYKKGF